MRRKFVLDDLAALHHEANAIEARDLAKSLLAKVRDVVGTLRRYEGHDIKPVLEALATDAPSPGSTMNSPSPSPNASAASSG